MAESTRTPALPSTADATPYVPISWMAVAAATVSGLFLIVMLLLVAWDIAKEKKPLLIPELLIMPVIGVVLSFAGRRMIRNSEGTRTGEDLVNLAWWFSVVGGLSFGAYLLAIDFSIRREAEGEVDRWVKNVMKDDPTDPTRIYLNRAFIATLDPQRRPNVLADNPSEIEKEFREQYIAFKQTDIIRMIHRNLGECSFTSGGVKEWIYRPNGVDCIFTGILKCPEGKFPFQISMRATEASAGSQASGRQWMLAIPPTGVFAQDQGKIARTSYGWLMEALEQSGAEFGKDFINRAGTGPVSLSEAYHLMIGPEDKLPLWNAVWQTKLGRTALGGESASFAPYFTPDFTKYFRDDFFKLPARYQITDAVLSAIRSADAPQEAIAKLAALKNRELSEEEFAKEVTKALGSEQKEALKKTLFKEAKLRTPVEPSREQKELFNKSWEKLGLFVSGTRLKNSSDKYPSTLLTDSAFETRVACELPLAGTESTVARCRLVVALYDPALIGELRRLHDEARPDEATEKPTSTIGSTTHTWRIVRVESDLIPISTAAQMRPSGGQAPQMPTMPALNKGQGPPPGPGMEGVIAQ